MTVNASEPKRPPPDRELGRWQFTLGRMFVATTAVAVVFSLAAWGGWVKSDAVAYVAFAVLAGVFSRAARQALVGACAILAALWLTGFLADITHGLYWRASPIADINPWPLWLAVPIIFYCAVFIRANAYATSWALIGSLVLVELFIAALIVHTCGYSTLLEALRSENREHVFREWVLQHYFPSRFYPQVCYIAIPWLLGIGLGEIVARRRKSGDRCKKSL
jgi:hypothetical protein